MKTRSYTPYFILLWVVLGLTLTSCAQQPAPTPVPMASNSGGRAANDSSAPRAEESAAGEAQEATPGQDAAGEISPALYNPNAGRMVIKDAQIELLVASTQAAIEQVTNLAAAQGGYIINSQTWYEGGRLFATLQLGVPSTAFEHTLNTLRNLGVKVLNETASGQDVSAEYTDLEARLANLEATSARVRSFLEAATTVEESLRVNKTLSDLEGQIEQVKGQMKFYEGRAAYSAVTVTLEPEIVPVTPAPTATPAPWNPSGTLDEASSVLVRAGQIFIDSLIWILVLAGPFAVVGLGLYWLFRRVVKSLNPPAKVEREGQEYS